MALSARAQRRIDAAIRGHARIEKEGDALGIRVGDNNTFVRLLRANGGLTASGRYYQQHLDEREGPVAPHERLDFFEDDAKRRSLRLAGGGKAEQVLDRFGNWQTTRKWDPAADGGRGGWRFTPIGGHWGHSSVRYIIEVPVTAHFRRPSGRVDSYAHQ